ncbi:MAG: hypothetical protein KJN98_02860 [Pontiella sp.]|nr:hypothetical protein [Pontiella sp.]
MNNTFRFGVVALLVFGGTVSAMAELREWKDQSGKVILAEHVATTGDRVVLRLEDGSEIKVSLDTLSEKDRRHAVLLTPPRIDISVSAKVDRTNTDMDKGMRRRGGVQIQEESIVATVTLKKSSPAPYEAPLQAIVYLMGQPEQHDGYVVIDRATSRFTFTTENKNQHTFTGNEVNLTSAQAGMERGIEYKGYIAVVRDKQGNRIAMKCSKLDFEKNADAIIGSKKGAIFDEDFNPVDLEKAKREKQQEKRFQTPGRRF